MSELTASEAAEILREIREGKRLEYNRFRKDRPDDWRERYLRHIEALSDAIEYIARVAQRTGQ